MMSLIPNNLWDVHSHHSAFDLQVQGQAQCSSRYATSSAVVNCSGVQVQVQAGGINMTCR